MRTIPDELAAVRAFVNTYDVEAGTDAIGDREGLGAWLSEHGLLAESARVTAGDVALAQRLRAALRALLRAHHDDSDDAAARADLNALAPALPLAVRLDDDGEVRLVPAARGVAGALAQLLAFVMTATVTGTWRRLKLCPEASCAWAFYDESRNRSRRWCSMEVCGNRTKTRAYRARQREES
jgi:predicted RNA-binding Zn ribbon-like protein